MKLKRICAALALVLLLTLSMAQAEGFLMNYAQRVVEEVNMERAKYGLSELRVDANLTAAAQIRAREIAQKFSHTRPDGTKWRTVSHLAYGENIARGQKTADKVMAAWMSSDGHRRNILKAGYTSIGVSCYKSGNIYHWVQLFGK